MPNGLAIAGLTASVIMYALLLVAITRRGEVRVIAALIGIALWTLSLFAFGALLTLEGGPSSSAGDFSCPIPGTSSEYAPSRWQWVPIGKVCELPSGDVGPSNWRTPVQFALLAYVPLGILALSIEDWRDENRRPVRPRATTSRAGA